MYSRLNRWISSWKTSSMMRFLSVATMPLRVILLLALTPLAFANNPLLQHPAIVELDLPNPPKADAIPNPVHLDLETLRVIRNHKMLRDYRQLSKVLDELQIQSQDDYRLERRVREAYLGISDESKSFYVEWLKQAPYSYQANLAAAAYYWKLGWAARGNRTASKTPVEQLERFRKNHAIALDYVNSAIQLRRNCRAAYSFKLSLLSTAGKEKETKALIQQTLRAFPDSTVMADAYMRALLPRWGGSYQQMKSIADFKVSQGKSPYEFYYLYGWIITDVADRTWRSEQVSVSQGLLELASQYGEALILYWSASLLAYNGFKDYELTDRLARKTINLAPALFNGYLMLAKSHAGRENYVEALNALAEARLVSNDIEIKRWRQKQARQLGRKALVWAISDPVNSSKYIKLAETFSPTYAVTTAYRGLIKAAQGNRPAGWLDVESAMRRAPNDFDVFRLMDYYWAMEGRFAQIILHWKQFLTRNPDHAEALHERAGTYYHLGKFRLAVEDAERACELKLKKACETAEQLKSRTQ